VRFFRVIDGFMAQFGIHGNPAVATAWRGANIKDDPVKQSNKRGFVVFATAGPNTRTTQLFINFGDNATLDKSGFAPFGEVSKGMDVVDKIYNGYGEGAPRGKGPDQGRVQSEGNAYLTKDFPKMDYVKTATIAKVIQATTSHTRSGANQSPTGDLYFLHSARGSEEAEKLGVVGGMRGQNIFLA
jgi:peptidyl-prolyl cis-trans isomerase A (cyclophilin A)